MDDLETAILISFDECGTADPVLKSQALAYCQQLKETSSICSLCMERISYTEFVQVQFWCLQTIDEVLRLRYSSMNPNEKLNIRKSVEVLLLDAKVQNLEESYAKIANVEQVIMAVNALSKVLLHP
ncbi:hypothetical protein HHK36_014404 [Tetracentron sinense]|uniref:Exportin-T n=1 Tax=Tetracentron sinense TaxID=13715 RepID=A0A835DFC6_TETSI|nr:hypothetical protein HHK36_014404 [Tetracentron sinense]